MPRSRSNLNRATVEFVFGQWSSGLIIVIWSGLIRTKTFPDPGPSLSRVIGLSYYFGSAPQLPSATVYINVTHSPPSRPSPPSAPSARCARDQVIPSLLRFLVSVSNSPLFSIFCVTFSSMYQFIALIFLMLVVLRDRILILKGGAYGKADFFCSFPFVFGYDFTFRVIIFLIFCPLLFIGFGSNLRVLGLD